MKIAPQRIKTYSITDEDVACFLRVFDEPVPGKVLEVGSHDEPVANILSDSGYEVIGIDLREYNPNQDVPNQGLLPSCNYTYVRHDFCALPDAFIKEHLGTFDIAVSLSAIEHFGLGTYREGGSVQLMYDVIAARTIWNLLKVGGVCYLTVPFGSQHLDVVPHWRVYDIQTVTTRLVQDFAVEGLLPFVAGDLDLDGKRLKIGDPLSWESACQFSGTPPHVSLLLKLRKISVHRLSPDGR